MRLSRRDPRAGQDRLVQAGLAATLIVVLAGAAAQLADYGFHLGPGPLDSSTDGGVFGVVGDLALASAALAAWGTLGRARAPTHAVAILAVLLTFLAIDKALSLHDHIPDWPAYYVPVLVAALVALVVVARELSRRSLRLMASGLVLLGAAFILHFTGETLLDKLHASHSGWAAEMKAVLKHGAELAGWLIVTLALVVGVRELPDRNSRGRRGRRALANLGPTAVDRSPTM
jgi:hypothetical protein